MMNQNNAAKKLAMAGVLTALAVAGSLVSFPVAGSKCAPVQHMVNVLASESDGYWKSDGVSGKHGGSFLLRHGLCRV